MKDAIGQEINIGDTVVVSNNSYRRLLLAKVTKIMNVRLEVEGRDLRGVDIVSTMVQSPQNVVVFNQEVKL